MQRNVPVCACLSEQFMPYSRLYEILYSKAGYHQGTGDTHGVPLVHEIHAKYSSNISRADTNETEPR